MATVSDRRLRFRGSSSATAWLERFIGASAEELRRRDSLAWLPREPAAMREELERRVRELGLCYTIVNAAFMDAVAPVVAELAPAAT